MKRNRVLLSVLALLVLVGMVLALRPDEPTLTILENGRPMANLVVESDPFLQEWNTDANGVVQNAEGVEFVFVPRPGGGATQVRYPQRGELTIDFRGRRQITTIRTTVLGFITKETTTEQFDLTDEEVEAVEKGETTFEEVRESIRQEAVE